MCVNFSLSATFYLSVYFNSEARALDSSCLQCVAYQRTRAVVVLLLLGMLDGRPRC